MRSLKTASQTFVDHFPDVSNMVVRGSECMVEILKSYKEAFITHYMKFEFELCYNFRLS